METGRVISVRESIVEVAFSGIQPFRHELLTLADDKSIKLEAYSSSREGTVFALVLADAAPLFRGAVVERTGEVITVPVGDAVNGRLINVFGDPQDGRDLLALARRPIYKPSPIYTDLFIPKEILETGVKAIDFFTPVRKGGKVGIFGGSGVGKTVLLLELIHNAELLKNTATIFCGIGERIREGHELYESLTAKKLLSKVALVFAEIHEKAAARFRVAYAGTTLAEYYRDEEGKDVIFFVDNLYRFIQAGNEVSTLLGRIPSEDWYQPTLASDVGMFEERLLSTKNAAVTSIQAIYVPADDMSDSGIQTAFAYFDSIIVLSRAVAGEGKYPAIDILVSSSSVINPDVLGKKHYDLFVEAEKILKRYSYLNRIVSIVGEYELAKEDQVIYHRARKLLNYMTQSFFVTADQTGRPGKYVPRAKTIADVADIISGKYDHISEEVFAYIGDLGEIRGRQKRA